MWIFPNSLQCLLRNCGIGGGIMRPFGFSPPCNVAPFTGEAKPRFTGLWDMHLCHLLGRQFVFCTLVKESKWGNRRSLFKYTRNVSLRRVSLCIDASTLLIKLRNSAYSDIQSYYSITVSRSTTYVMSQLPASCLSPAVAVWSEDAIYWVILPSFNNV